MTGACIYSMRSVVLSQWGERRSGSDMTGLRSFNIDVVTTDTTTGIA